MKRNLNKKLSAISHRLSALTTKPFPSWEGNEGWVHQSLIFTQAKSGNRFRIGILSVLLTLFFLAALSSQLAAQNMSINRNGTLPDPSAMLDVSDTASGFLMPRMTAAQRMNINSPANGLMVYQTDGSVGLYIYDNVGGTWEHVLDSASVAALINAAAGDIATVLGEGSDAGGDSIFNLAVAQSDSIRAGKLNINGAFDLPTGDGTNGQVLQTDGSGNVTWQTTGGGNTLDGAYDQGGSGSGRTVTADNGAVKVAGTDGFMVTGTLSSGANVDETGAGVRMFYNPKTAAFRAGRVSGTDWDQSNLGTTSIGLGYDAEASGTNSVSIGNSTSATGNTAVAIGNQTVASNTNSIAIGSASTTSSAIGAVAIGAQSTASGNYSSALGFGVLSRSQGEVAVGVNSTDYTPNSTSSFNSADRVFTVGNGVNLSNRSDALIIYKSGDAYLNGILSLANGTDTISFPNTDGTNGQVLQTDGSGNVTWGTVSGDGNGIYDGGGSLTGNTTVSQGSNSLSFTSTQTNGFSVDGTTFSVDAANNRIGIGTDAPEARLEISENAVGNAGASHMLVLESNRVSNLFGGEGPGILFKIPVSGTATVEGAAIEGVRESSNDGQRGTSMIFRVTSNPDTLAEAMRINSNGFLGINTTNPTFGLDVDTSASVNELNINSAFTFPTADGSNGQILQTDGSGNVTWETISAGGSDSTYITDADGDTKIQVEETGDEDIIRFDLEGTEKFIITGSRIEPKNSGNSLFIGENAGANDDLSSNSNIAIGNNALSTATTANRNTVLGIDALTSATSGGSNVAIGYKAMEDASGGSSNIAIGWNSLNKTTVGSHNISLGDFSGQRVTTGLYNILLGEQAGANITTSNNNVLLGRSAGQDGNGIENVAIGLSAGRANAGVRNVSIGVASGQNNSGSYNSFLGSDAGQNSSGSYNVYLGFQSGETTTGSNNVFLGKQAGETIDGSDLLIIENSNSSTPLIWGDFANDSVKIHGVLQVDAAGSGDALLVLEADEDNNNENDNPSISFLQDGGATRGAVGLHGSDNLLFPNTPGNSLLIGMYSNEDVTFFTDSIPRMTIEGGGSVGIGTTEPGYDLHIVDETGNGSVQIESEDAGSDAYINFVTTESEFQLINYGADSKFYIYSDNSGTDALVVDTFGRVGINMTDPSAEFEVQGRAIADTLEVDGEYTFPAEDGTNGQVMQTDGSGNVTWETISSGSSDEIADADNDTKIQVEETGDEDIIRFDLAGTEFLRLDSGRIEPVNTGRSIFLGENAGENDDFSDNQNVFIGENAGRSNTSGNNNFAIGYQALEDNETGTDNIAIGIRTLQNTTGDFNTAIGTNVLSQNTTGTSNVGIGPYTMTGNTTGLYNVGIGRFVLQSNQTGSNNIGIGFGALRTTTATGNVAVGHRALYTNVSGQYNASLGDRSLDQNVSGSYNSAFGSRALFGLEDSDYNSAFGYQALYNFESGARNVVMGADAGSYVQTGNNNVLIGYQAGLGGYTSHSKSGNIFIGYQAGFNDTTDNKLYIENSNSSTPLIYGDFANDSVKIHGSLSLGDEFTFPTADGTTGQVLQTDGSGNVTWGSVSGGGGSSDIIEDADGDTRIETETSTDVDEISFFTDGTERMRVNSTGKISVGNNHSYPPIMSFFSSTSTDTAAGYFVNTKSTGTTYGVVGEAQGAGTINIGVAGYATGASSNRAIYGIAPSPADYAAYLEGRTYIEGNLTISNGSNPFTFPNSDGSNGQVLQTDGSGTLSWVTPSSSSSSGADNDWDTTSTGGTVFNLTDSIGIGTSSPDEIFDVEGTAEFNEVKIEGAFALPTSDGSSGEYLKTDGSGNTYWSTPSKIVDPSGKAEIRFTNDSIIQLVSNNMVVFSTYSDQFEQYTEFDDGTLIAPLITTGRIGAQFNSSINFSSDIRPLTNGSRLNGTNLYRWKSIYSDSLNILNEAIVGTLNVNNAFSLPTTDGTNGQVLQTDGSGSVTWEDAAGDDLGNHTATQALNLNGNYLSGDGDDEGIHVNNSGNVTIGGSTGFDRLSVRDSNNLDLSFLSITGHTEADFYSYGNSISGTELTFRRSRGQLLSSSSVAFNDRIVQLNTGTFDGSSTYISPFMEVVVGGTPSTGIVPTQIELSTVDFAGNSDERLIIEPDGRIGMGNSSAQYPLHLNTDVNGIAMGITDDNNGGNLTHGFSISNQNAIIQLKDSNANIPVYLNTSGDSWLTGGDLGIGTSSPLGNLEITDSGNVAVNLSTYSNIGAQSGRYNARRARGTSSTPTIVADGDDILRLNAKAYDGSAFELAARISMEVDGTPGAGDMPGRIRFMTTPDGSTTPTERMRIDSDGNVGIGASNQSSKLDVDGDVEVSDDDAFYFGDPTTDGTWRITRDGNNLVFERRESGSWVTKTAMTP